MAPYLLLQLSLSLHFIHKSSLELYHTTNVYHILQRIFLCDFSFNSKEFPRNFSMILHFSVEITSPSYLLMWKVQHPSPVQGKKKAIRQEPVQLVYLVKTSYLLPFLVSSYLKILEN